jgi:hypothetical protein
MYAFKLNLPMLPKHFSDSIMSGEKFTNLDGYGTTRDFVDSDKKNKRSITVAKFSVEHELKEWVQENISTDHHKIAITTVEKKSDTANIFSAHTDLYRSWVLIYYISTGGNSTTLNFYQEKNHNKIRELGLYSTDYSQLEKIASYYPKNREWWLLNTMVLHDVQNIDSARMTIHINFWDDTIKSIKDPQILKII